MLKLILWYKMKRLFVLCLLIVFTCVSNAEVENQNDNDSYPDIVYKYKNIPNFSTKCF